MTPLELFIVLFLTATVIPLAAMVGQLLAIAVLRALVALEDGYHRARGVFR